jgi:hypothetical protein
MNEKVGKPWALVEIPQKVRNLRTKKAKHFDEVQLAFSNHKNMQKRNKN